MEFKNTKTLYHSDLTKVGGPVGIIIDGPMLASKFRAGEFNLPVKIVGDDSKTYWLTMENPNVQAAFAQQPQGVPLSVVASGSRDAATVAIGGGQAAAQAPPQAVESPVPGNDPFGAQGQPQPAPVPQAPVQAPTPTRPGKNPDELGQLMATCVGISGKMMQDFEQMFGRPMSPEEQSIAVTLFIQLNR